MSKYMFDINEIVRVRKDWQWVIGIVRSRDNRTSFSGDVYNVYSIKLNSGPLHFIDEGSINPNILRYNNEGDVNFLDALDQKLNETPNGSYLYMNEFYNFDGRFYTLKTGANKPKAPEPKYDINDIVIVKEVSYGNQVYEGVVGIIKDRFNHKLSGDVYYHVIFNSGTPQKVWEFEIDRRQAELKNEIKHRLYEYLIGLRGYMLVDGFFSWLDRRSSLKFNHSGYGLKVKDIFTDEWLFKGKMTFEEVWKEIGKMNKFDYNKIIFNGPCTIVLWADGTKTIAKLYEDIDKFDPEKGVAICFMKKILGHTVTNKILREATKQYAEDKKESNGDWIEKIKEAFTPMKEYLNGDISSAIKEVKQVEDEERAKEAVKHAPDSIKYHLYTGEEIKVSADNNTSEIFFDDTKEEDTDDSKS